MNEIEGVAGNTKASDLLSNKSPFFDKNSGQEKKSWTALNQIEVKDKGNMQNLELTSPCKGQRKGSYNKGVRYDRFNNPIIKGIKGKTVTFRDQIVANQPLHDTHHISSSFDNKKKCCCQKCTIF